jgi:nitroimidazol reductase NimA-like FMN-containing flavoprotein (pyridoxamine 5'-phosphate oxidase superfamily)
VLDDLLDEGLVGHLGVVEDGQPFVLPVGYARDGDTVVMHGSTASRLFRLAVSGVPVCLTVTLLDGFVFARSVFNSSMNYRSAVIIGAATAVASDDDKLAALRRLSERMAPGHWGYARQPVERELRATAVLRLPIEEWSVKVSAGPPDDDAPDYELPLWAGIVPLHATAGAPEPDPALRDAVAPPSHVTDWPDSRNRGREAAGGVGHNGTHGWTAPAADEQ